MSKLRTFWSINWQFLKLLAFPMKGYGFVIKSLFSYVKILKLPATLLEAFSIAPTFVNLIANFNLFESWRFLISDLNIEEWISLSRFKSHPLDRIWCDWCSIVNGINEMIYHKIITGNLNEMKDQFNDKKNANIPFFLRYVMKLKYVPFTLYNEHQSLTSLNNEQINILDGILDPVTKNKIESFFMFYNTIKLTEQRWCPFKYIQDLVKYDRDYYCFSSDNESNLYVVGQILREQGMVSACANNHDSVYHYMTTINNSDDVVKSEYPSIFDDYMRLLKSS